MGGGGGLVKLKLKLDSAKTETKASSLGLAELGKNAFGFLAKFISAKTINDKPKSKEVNSRQFKSKK